MSASSFWLLVIPSPSACKGRGSLDAQLEFILATKMKVHLYILEISIINFDLFKIKLVLKELNVSFTILNLHANSQ